MSDDMGYEYWAEYPAHDPQSMVWYPLTFAPIDPDAVWGPTDTSTTQNSTSFYVHVPFCKVVCPFCPFNKYPLRDKHVEQFVAAALQEIDLLSSRGWAGSHVRAAYFGGGTGTAISREQLYSLLQRLTESLRFDANTEVTVEGSPETITLDKLRMLRDCGVTRISFGVQSWDDRYLKMLGRGHDAELARTTLKLARKAGFDNVAIDLMYRLPGQTLDEWRQDLKQSIELGVDHISAYSLFVEPGAPLARIRSRGRLLSQADEMADLEMFAVAMDVLGEAGMELYTLYDFAPAAKRCQHHLVNWAAPQGEYIGIGPGAFSYVRNAGGEFVYGNTNPIEKYVNCLERGRLPIEFGTRMGRDEQMARYMVLGINALHVPKGPFEEQFGGSVDDAFGPTLARLSEWGLITNSEESVDVTPRGALYISNVGKAFATKTNSNVPHPAGVDLQKGEGKSLVGLQLLE